MQARSSSSEYGSIDIRLRHPSQSVTQLARAIGRPTSYEWEATDLLDRGPDLPPKPRGENYWCAKTKLTRGSFADALQSILTDLSGVRKDLNEFTRRSGRVEIYLQLDGRENVGDVLSPSLLKAISDLGAELHIEVFPNN